MTTELDAKWTSFFNLVFPTYEDISDVKQYRHSSRLNKPKDL
jgi:hypothetical protein